MFTFTCEDYDDCHDTTTSNQNIPEEQPPPVPPPPIYDLSSESGDAVCLPPQMRPIDTKLTLDLFNARHNDTEFYRGRCTAIDECVSACECCRSPQPETSQIPYIDEPDCEPVIFENDISDCRVATPKVRRILPSLSLDKPDEIKPETADAMCQTPCLSLTDNNERNIDYNKKPELKLELKHESKKGEYSQCRLKRALFSMSKSVSSKSDDIDMPTYSTAESFSETSASLHQTNNASNTSKGTGAKQILDSIDRKSWKSPDEYRPAFGTVKALAKHFNSINLRYCARTYKRHCQSSPNLTMKNDHNVNIKETLQSSASLANLLYQSRTETTPTEEQTKLSDEEVRSILIQLEDWSKYGSRGSEDTLAHGNEFELPNLPSEEPGENRSANNIVFNEIVDKKPKIITLDNIKLKTNTSSILSPEKDEVDSNKFMNSTKPRVVALIPRQFASSLSDISRVAGNKDGGGITALRALMRRSCPLLAEIDARPTPLLSKAPTSSMI